ncbi:MAG: hypothetical protein HYX90_10430 [Chloroflexi bacterium]|nr:hypothetical protein [Chloroflexota bacterium]
MVGSANNAMGSLLRHPAAKYSYSDLSIILAIVGGSVQFLKAGIINKPEDIVRAKGIVYGHSPGGGSRLFVLAKEFIGFPTDKVVLAYTGSGDAMRAFFAGETNASNMTIAAYTETLVPHVGRGEVMLLFQQGIFDQAGNLVGHPGFPPNLMTGKELHEKIHGKSPSGVAWEAYLAIVTAIYNFDRPMLIHGKTPYPIKRAYWAAAEAMIRDAEVLKTADRVLGGSTLMAGEAFDKQYSQVFGMKPEVADWITEFMMTKYGIAVME